MLALWPMSSVLYVYEKSVGDFVVLLLFEMKLVGNSVHKCEVINR